MFLSLIDEVKQQRETYTGTLIFCSTRKQCSLIYNAFAVALGEKLYIACRKDPRKRILDMYHAGTRSCENTQSVSADIKSRPSTHTGLYHCFWNGSRL